jgi:hypothetical protein
VASPGIARSLPNNVDAERSILGAILLDNEAIAIAVKHVSSGDFFFSGNQKIFRRMMAMRDAGQPIELVMLCEALHANGELDGAGGAPYISALADGMPKVSNVEHYAKIVREKAVLRRMVHFGDRLTRDALDPGADITALQNNLRALTSESVEPMKIVGGNGHLSYSLIDFLKAEFPIPEHLVEGLIPRGGTVMIVAMPHHLKSWFTTSLALATSVAGIVLGKLEVRKPVRTLLIQVEDFPGQVQWRLGQLLKTQDYKDCDPQNVRIIPRCALHLPDEAWYQALLREVERFHADHVILDVVRRIFRGDINSQKETSPFLEQLDRLREVTNATTTLVHHENRKEADLMYASAGSYTLPSWANVMVQFKRKTQEGSVSHVEIEVDNKLAQSPDPMRMILDLTSETPVRLEAVEDAAGVQDLRNQLGIDWTVRDLQEVLGVAKTNATRRMKKLLAAGIIEKITSGKRGRAGGLARYGFVGADA